ncbi:MULTISPECIES: relaxase/mobilization nuclease domain-containing protein [Pantoea]|uniref:Relaxase/Mobilisation nuclease domain-containing protein n=1 Tax=Candidatus Pantoea floridensis TaxID=1938870 RepID=A0A286BW23_9GAMM|nr:relaxase/mobilization nuclease domain-containing protein [Pantoea floridensis]PIF20834.1 relaxase/mobilization nuclease-like protein [Enterobacteriaceae bacterium JKS000233]SOD38350.1 Relaxase/Mobilisation nuclease domain-containing protein [Pantoea floridensis]
MKGMQKIRRGKSFKGVVSYVLAPAPHHKTDPMIIGGNMIGLSVVELTVEFMRTHKLRPDVQKPVWHNSLRLPIGESISNEQWKLVADDYMKRMGFCDTHLRCYVLHDDEAGQHIHIIASRINVLADGLFYLGRNENLKSTRIIQELERDHNLTRTKGLSLPSTPKVRKTGRNEEMMEARTGNKAPKKIIQEAIEAVLSFYGTITIEDFVYELSKLKITAKASIASTGKMNGFSFEYAGIAFKASQLGKAYSWSSLSKRVILTAAVEPQKIADTELPEEELVAVERVTDIEDEPVFHSPAIPHIEETNTKQVRWLLWVPYLKQIIQALKATGLSILKPSIKMKPFHIVTPTQNTGDKKSLAIIKESTTGKKRFSI